MEIPVIITYFGGKPSYLIYALKSAARTNNEVVLIGDKTNKNLFTRKRFNLKFYFKKPVPPQRTLTKNWF